MYCLVSSWGNAINNYMLQEAQNNIKLSIIILFYKQS